MRVLAASGLMLGHALAQQAGAPPGAHPSAVAAVTLPRSGPPPPEQRTYEDNFTFKWRSSFNLDPWVWGYTQEFARRFRMPEKLIEPWLQGALAVAFRMTTLGRTTCGLSGREENCWHPLDCQMDLYLDSRTPLPWRRPEIQQDSFLQSTSSSEFVDPMGKNRQMIAAYGEGGGAGITGVDARMYRMTDKGLQNTASGFVIYFDRNFRPGVTLISYKGLCPKSPDASQIIFREWAVLEQVLLRKLRPEDAPAMHRVQIPGTYMQRAARVYQQRDHQASQEVIQPLRHHVQPDHPNRSVK
jgi:hypothetical protein